MNYVKKYYFWGNSGGQIPAASGISGQTNSRGKKTHDDLLQG